MNGRIESVALLLIGLAACYDSGDARQDPELRKDGGAMHEPADAQVDERVDAASEPVRGGAEDGSSELQAWVGLAHLLDGRRGLACGSETEPKIEYRALLLLEVSAEGELEAASLSIGEGEARLPEVEDADAYYPPDPPWNWHGCPMRGLVPGFEYTAYEARLDDERFSASIRPSEVVKPWCELQPSYPASPAAAMWWGGEYFCRPTDRFIEVYDLNEAVPTADDFSVYFPEELCFRENAPCMCDADSCTASRYGAMHVDLSIDGDSMTGRFAWMELKLERRASERP